LKIKPQLAKSLTYMLHRRFNVNWHDFTFKIKLYKRFICAPASTGSWKKVLPRNPYRCSNAPFSPFSGPTKESGRALRALQWIRAEAGRQRTSSAFWVENHDALWSVLAMRHTVWCFSEEKWRYSLKSTKEVGPCGIPFHFQPWHQLCWGDILRKRKAHVITALHWMQTRSSDEKAVRPSVCLSDKRVDCDKTEKDLSRFLYLSKEHLA